MRLNSDIQNLLDAALITSKGLHSRRDWTDPTDVIDAAAERIRLRFPKRFIELSLNSNLPLIQIDPVLVEQALSQIIANAAKFSNPPSIVQVAATVENGQLLISVRDEGVGLNTEEKSDCPSGSFVVSVISGKISGSGLGLWIAKSFRRKQWGQA